jgi:cell division septation protein DedD
MDDVLTKRLLGACVLVVSALLLTRLLPAPHVLPEPANSAQRVIYDLRKPQFELSTAQIEALLAPFDAAGLVARWLPPMPVEPVAVSIPLHGPSDETRQVTVRSTTPRVQTTAPAALKPKAGIPAPKPPVPAKPLEAADQAPTSASGGKSSAPPSAAALGGWFVQIGVFALEINARQSAQRLRAAGLEARILSLDTAAGPRQRVRAGPYGSREQALAARATVVSLGYPDARVLEPGN